MIFLLSQNVTDNRQIKKEEPKFFLDDQHNPFQEQQRWCVQTK
jgi:hypothetical protein